VQAWGSHVSRGDVVVCLHGYPSHSGEHEYARAPLVSAGYRVVAIDMPGFG
jgi:pimeloyl-ACP methyl ester carboxylesterase